MSQKLVVVFLLTLGFGMAATSDSIAQPGTASSLDRQPQKLARAPQVNKKKDANDDSTRAAQNSRAKQAPLRLTKAKKAALIQFVRQNHPQLLRLLKQLEKQDAAKYQLAMRGLLRDYDRLETFRDNEERYKNGVRDWTLKSQIQLAAVRYAMNETLGRKKVLADLVKKQLAIRTDQLNAESERLKKRMSRIEENLDRIESNRPAEVERLIGAATNSVKRALISKKTDKPKTDKPKTDKPKTDKANPAKQENDPKKKNAKIRDDKISSP